MTVPRVNVGRVTIEALTEVELENGPIEPDELGKPEILVTVTVGRVKVGRAIIEEPEEVVFEYGPT